MKKIILAWIEQIIEFDSEMEYVAFQHGLKNSKKKSKVLEEKKLADGKYSVHIRRQYNNNAFPEGGEPDV